MFSGDKGSVLGVEATPSAVSDRKEAPYQGRPLTCEPLSVPCVNTTLLPLLCLTVKYLGFLYLV